jgi:hypothetical protein
MRLAGASTTMRSSRHLSFYGRLVTASAQAAQGFDSAVDRSNGAARPSATCPVDEDTAPGGQRRDDRPLAERGARERGAVRTLSRPLKLRMLSLTDPWATRQMFLCCKSGAPTAPWTVSWHSCWVAEFARSGLMTDRRPARAFKTSAVDRSPCLPVCEQPRSSAEAPSDLSAMRDLCVLASYSRPRVSNDNAYAEALFRTAKYFPLWPERPFDSLEQGSRRGRGLFASSLGTTRSIATAHCATSRLRRGTAGRTERCSSGERLSMLVHAASGRSAGHARHATGSPLATSS